MMGYFYSSSAIETEALAVFVFYPGDSFTHDRAVVGVLAMVVDGIAGSFVESPVADEVRDGLGEIEVVSEVVIEHEMT
jgi:hypothetical protein